MFSLNFFFRSWFLFLRDLVYGAARQSAGVTTSGSSAKVVPTVASKIALPSTLRGFDPTPYLPQPCRDAYLWPDTLVKEGGEVAGRAIMTSSQTELRRLFWKWDAVDRLFLSPNFS